MQSCINRIDFSKEVYPDAIVWVGEFLSPIAKRITGRKMGQWR